jgi:putative transposase
VHHGHATQLNAQRQLVLDAANPERFVRKAPTPSPLPSAAWINKPDNEEAAH